MRYILKVLLISIVGLFLDNNTEATTQVQQPGLPKTVFDLPPDTPGLMNDKQNKTICGQQKACVHVIIPQTEAYKAYTDNRLKPLNSKERAEHACSADGNIYFPADGTQPTAKEVAEYSCANIDNRADSPITKWYMQVFGVIDKNGRNSTNDNDYIKAGYNHKSEDIVPIFTFPDDNHCESFIKIFKMVAKTSLGRSLLYRIIIEIRRRNANNFGCYQSSKQRQFFRTLSVKSTNRFYFSGGSIKYYIHIPCKFEIVKDGYIILTNPQNLDMDTELSIILFHEMLHWFHDLSDEDYHEKTEGLSLCHDFEHKNNNELYNYYYGHSRDSGVSIKNSLRGWSCQGNSAKINTEEWRTIAGINGELSENAFRVSLGVPLRIFHEGAHSVDEEITTNRCKFIKKESLIDSRYKINKEENNNIDEYDVCCKCLRCCLPYISSQHDNTREISTGFICLGKENTTTVNKMQEQALQCCHNYDINNIQVNMVDIGISETDFDGNEKQKGFGDAFFYKSN